MFLTCQCSCPASFIRLVLIALSIALIFTSLDFHLGSFAAQPFHIFKFMALFWCV